MRPEDESTPVNAARLETVKQTLEAARRDVDDESQRTEVLDGKLTNLASFSALSISISGAVGGSVLAQRRLSLGFSIALGAVLVVAALLLLAAVVACFRGLAPKLFQGVSVAGAHERVKVRQLKRNPEVALAFMATTQVKMLARARAINERKAAAATRAFLWVGLGFGSLVLALVVTAIGVVTR